MSLLCAAALFLSFPQSVRAEVEARIIGGAKVEASAFATRWPFMGAIVRADNANEYGGQFCGASLIAPTLLVTAAHCVMYAPSTFAGPLFVDIVTGRRDLDDDSTGQRLNVAGIFVHPNFNTTTFANDVAVIRLAAASTSPQIPLIGEAESVLWGGGNGLTHTSATGPWISGWGNRSYTGQIYSDNLYQATVPIIADSACEDAEAGGLTGFDRTNMLCAGLLDTDGSQNSTNGVDTCQGDSGGPLIVSDTVNNTGSRLVGITSWGEGCAGGTYGVYSRVDALRAWIQSVNAVSGGPGGIMDPQALTLTGATETSANIEWNAPESGPVPANYAVYVEFAGIQNLMVTTSGTAHRINGLQPAEEYRFVVKASDESRNRSAGAVINIATAPDLAAPTRPGYPYYVSRSRSSLSVGWRAATDNVAVSRYRVYIYKSGSWRLAGSTASRKFTARSLMSGRRYYFKIRAIDSSGNISTASQVRSYRTAP